MKVIWVNKSFSDYRVPVYAELDKLLNGNLFLIFSGDYTNKRVQQKIKALFGQRAIVLGGERIIWRKGDLKSDFANAYTEIGYQPGLYHEIKKINPDVIIGEGFFKWSLAAFIYRILHSTPLVISYERTHHTERKSQWFRTLYRKLVIRYLDAMCCNGRLSAEYSNWLGMPEDQIVIGSMAADSEELQRKYEVISAERRIKLRQILKLNEPVFLYVGQLVERKGVLQLLESWGRLGSYSLQKRGSLVIVGDGPMRGILEEFTKDKALKNVHFIGAVDYDNIAQYYAIADVFVMPTLEDNWSLVVPEAMACGLPILCSIYNGCWPELVINDINGYTFDPYDAEETCRRLKVFIDNPENALIMGEASRQIVADFSPVNAAKVIYEACQIAVQKNSKKSKFVSNALYKRKKRVVIVTNIPTPYREDLFSMLTHSAKINAKVFFCSRSERRQLWDVKSFLSYPHTFLKGFKIDRKNGTTNFNPDLIPTLRDFKPDTIIVGGASISTLNCIIYRQLFGCKLLIWWAGTNLSEANKSRVVELFRKWLFKRVDGFLCYSHLCEQYLKSFNIQSDSITVIGNNALDVERYSYAIQNNKKKLSRNTSDRFNMLVVSQLIQRKNIVYILEAFLLISRKYPNIILKIAGTGSEEFLLKEFCKSNNLHNVYFLGNVQPQDLKKYYAEADVLLSVAHMDQWPQVVNEAMSCGIPVIASTTSGIDNYFLQDGVNGYLVDPTDLKSLFDRLEFLLLNLEKTKLMGQEAYRIARKYDVHHAIQCIENAILNEDSLST